MHVMTSLVKLKIPFTNMFFNNVDSNNERDCKNI